MALGREFARAIQGVPDNELALPFTEPAPIPFHAWRAGSRRWMLLAYRQRDRREI